MSAEKLPNGGELAHDVNVVSPASARDDELEQPNEICIEDDSSTDSDAEEDSPMLRLFALSMSSSME